MVFWVGKRIGVCAEGEPYPPGIVLINVMDLVDGKNDPSKIVEKLNIAQSLLRNHGVRIVFECHAGVSRSPTLAAALLTITNNVTLDDALSHVSHAVLRAQFNYDLVDSVRDALKIMSIQ